MQLDKLTALADSSTVSPDRSHCDKGLCSKLGGLEPGVAEHLGHVADVRSALEHQGGHGVSQQVAAAALVDACGGQISPHPATQPVRAQRRPRRREEQ
jgi:hypothetical protein